SGQKELPRWPSKKDRRLDYPCRLERACSAAGWRLEVHMPSLEWGCPQESSERWHTGRTHGPRRRTVWLDSGTGRRQSERRAPKTEPTPDSRGSRRECRRLESRTSDPFLGRRACFGLGTLRRASQISRVAARGLPSRTPRGCEPRLHAAGRLLPNGG